MPVYGAFSIPTLGMMAQSNSMQVIGGNIANVNTGGFKSTDVRFQTVLSETLSGQSDLGGIRTSTMQNVRGQGHIVSSVRDLDIAIEGQGLFVLNTESDGSGDAYYTRDGSLHMKTVDPTTKETYLVDKNDYFVMGWEADTSGIIATTGALSSIRVDPGGFGTNGEATSEVAMNVNVPSQAATSDTHTYRLEVFDSTFGARNIDVNFTKNAAVNTWDVSIGYPGPPTAQVDTVTLAGTVGVAETGDTYSVTVGGNTVTYTTVGTEADINAVRDALITKINADATVNTAVTAAAGAGAGEITLTAVTAGTAFTAIAGATNGGATADNTAGRAPTTANSTGTTTTATQQLAFTGKGQAATSTPLSYTLTWPGASTSTIAFDFANATQYAGEFISDFVTKNGLGLSNLSSVKFDELGHVVGHFEDGSTRKIAKLGLGTFLNPNALKSANGNIYSATGDSGEVTIKEASDGGFARFAPNAIEGSNVNLADQFTKMILTQNAYNSSATVFKTIDEMTVSARDLKR